MEAKFIAFIICYVFDVYEGGNGEESGSRRNALCEYAVDSDILRTIPTANFAIPTLR